MRIETADSDPKTTDMFGRDTDFSMLFVLLLDVSRENLLDLEMLINPLISRTDDEDFPDPVRIAAMSFDRYRMWFTDKPVAKGIIPWNPSDVQRCRNFGPAFDSLYDWLSENYSEALDFSTPSPTFILISDNPGAVGLESSIRRLSKEKWFSRATRLAFCLGDEYVLEKLTLFTGDPELVLVNPFSQTLMRIIRDAYPNYLAKSDIPLDPDREDPVHEPSEHVRSDGLEVFSENTNADIRMTGEGFASLIRALGGRKALSGI